MKIAPHNVIETVRDSKLSPETWRAPHTLPALVGLIARATVFEFGELRPDQAHIDFGLDLLDRDLFTLPFPITAFSFQGTPDHIRMRGDKRRGGMCILYQHEGEKSLTMISCNEMVDQSGRTVGAIPMALVSRARFANRAGTSVDSIATTQAIVSDRVLRAMYGGTTDEAHDALTQRTANNMVQCVGLAVMLMSRGVATERIEAPAKLNKARAARNKPIIADRYEVTIKAGDCYAIQGEDGEDDQNIQGHKRGSPRPHWRRGHIRCIHRGTPNEYFKPIAPMIVAANGNADLIVPKGYKVTR